MATATARSTPGAPVLVPRSFVAAAARLEARHGDALAKTHRRH